MLGWFVTQCGSLSQHCSDSTGYSLVLCGMIYSGEWL